jgi:tRNA threonylcarbamoyladenosine biosynthesis protein TsaE
MKKTLKIESPEQMVALGKMIGSNLFSGSLVTLNGDLGAGKTTLTKGIGQALHVRGTINSPTFTIMKIYNGDKTLYHLDVYRLSGVGGDFDLEEYFYKDGVSVIEWAEIITPILPEGRLDVTIRITGETTRDVLLETASKAYAFIEDLKI